MTNGTRSEAQTFRPQSCFDARFIFSLVNPFNILDTFDYPFEQHSFRISKINWIIERVRVFQFKNTFDDIDEWSLCCSKLMIRLHPYWGWQLSRSLCVSLLGLRFLIKPLPPSKRRAYSSVFPCGPTGLSYILGVPKTLWIFAQIGHIKDRQQVATNMSPHPVRRLSYFKTQM